MNKRIVRIDVAEIGHSGRFEASWQGDIIARSDTPLFDSARVLVKRGLSDGWIEMWGGDPPMLRMSMPIAEAAGLTVTENSRDGPHFGKHRSPPAGGLKFGQKEVIG